MTTHAPTFISLTQSGTGISGPLEWGVAINLEYIKTIADASPHGCRIDLVSKTTIYVTDSYESILDKLRNIPS